MTPFIACIAFAHAMAPKHERAHWARCEMRWWLQGHGIDEIPF